ncbi:peptidylprolyl isomerase [Zunongwangia sp. HRR-M8]|uniref:peptidylprolyl isomerase n=1 Tax=Zunongwangia sp. HRR-M8 TaxID=3015170 RepID=UPI0022DD9879|nr:peptidylprolyl isomerase [Zunongwangia sp. HRR-M8]WBL23498.1 peptidylprolyl isomerase [Zunongwangia sp. HRR-M8]
MKKFSLLFLSAIVLVFTACKEDYPDLEDGMYAKFDTSMGPIVAELYYDQTPITVASFVSLAEGNSTMVDSTYKDKNFYDGLIFHRIIDGFMIQGGDPTGTGRGGPGYRFPDETIDSLSHDSKGILSMANAGPGTNGSQFFITLVPTPNLDGRHTVFGKVVKGQDVVDAIGKVETDPRDRPVKDVTINTVEIIRKGKAARKFDAPEVFKEELEKIKKAEEEEARKLEETKKENKAMFDKYRDEAKTLESGLGIYILKEGNGPKPKIGQQVGVDYEGYFLDGGIFDTSKEDIAKKFDIFNEMRSMQGGYAPLSLKYGPDSPMIAGFKEGIMEMKVGDKAILYIPSHLAYGERGKRPIEPNTDLIFVVELVEIKD